VNELRAAVRNVLLVGRLAARTYGGPISLMERMRRSRSPVWLKRWNLQANPRRRSRRYSLVAIVWASWAPTFPTIQERRDLGVRINGHEAAAKLVAVCDPNRPGFVFRAVTQSQQLFEHHRHLHTIRGAERIKLQGMATNG
jgi:hypothetical protein